MHISGESDMPVGSVDHLGVCRLSNKELLEAVRCIDNMDQLRDFFKKERVKPEQQLEVVLTLGDESPDLSFREALVDYAEKLVKVAGRLGNVKETVRQRISDKVRISLPEGQKRVTFCLTEAGKEVMEEAWSVFFEGLVGQRLVDRDEVDGYRSLIGLTNEPLTRPLHFGGSNQQLMFIFAALYGTLVYESQVDDYPLRKGVRYTFEPLIATPSGGAARGRHITDPYCQTLAAAVLDRHDRPLVARQLTSAKNMLENTLPKAGDTTVKSLKPHLVAKLMRLLPNKKTVS